MLKLIIIRQILVESARYYRASKNAYTALLLKPDYAKTYNNLGASYMKLNRLDKASVMFHRALCIEQLIPQVYHNDSIAKNKLREYQAAIQLLHKAIKIMPSFSDAHNFLANNLKEVGQVSAAVERYKLAFCIDPLNLTTLDNLAYFSAQAHNSRLYP